MASQYKRLILLLLMAACVGALGAAGVTAIDMTGEAEPSWVETRLAQTLLHLKLGTKRSKTPLLDVNEEDRQKANDIYEQQCAFCHGATRGKEAPFAKSLSPRPPQFTIQPSRRPTWRDAYVIQHGVRWSGMPAFHGFSETETWRLALYVEGRTQPQE
jgi:mono/diheme cytochrome c family protein